jgi:hypothetical protein
VTGVAFDKILRRAAETHRLHQYFPNNDRDVRAGHASECDGVNGSRYKKIHFLPCVGDVPFRLVSQSIKVGVSQRVRCVPEVHAK